MEQPSLFERIVEAFEAQGHVTDALARGLEAVVEHVAQLEARVDALQTIVSARHGV